MFENMIGLLTIREEREIHSTDKYGPFSVESSPRWDTNLMEVPVFNEAVSALIAACIGLKEFDRPKLDLLGSPLNVDPVLSHDCDILLGNDIITQAIRGYRVLEPLMRGKPPNLKNIWWILRNAIRPKDFYFNEINGIIEVEREYGFTSAFYLLNGSKGRYGARSGSDILP